MTVDKEFDAALLSLSGGSVTGHRYLLGVSGGIDSMCMAGLFLRSGLRPEFAIAHVNFSLRGEESDGDMALVQDWGRRNGVRVYTRTFDTHAYAAGHSISTQMAARELRYGFFAELMREEGFDLLSIAHNLDDSIETIFLNIARGTGLRGLSGIPVRNGNIIRPLMSVSRARIREFVEQAGIVYRDDHTNFESHYARNKVRNIIFPEFRKINPSFLNTVRRDSEYFREASEIVDEVYASVCSRTCAVSGDGVMTVDTAALQREGHCGYWLYRMLRKYGFSGGQVSDMERCIVSGQSGRVFRSGTHEAVFGHERMRVYPLRQDEEAETVMDGPGVYDYMDAVVKLEFFPRPETFSPVTDGSVLYFTADGLRMPLVCRNWRPADRFRPFGMKKGSKKLSDFFTDLKLDRVQKRLQPVIEDEAGQIVCLPGLRIDDRFRITASTSVVCAVSFYSK
ncbi:MAG TPA: tRNA lysidine(34) synthetase TilS [Candidatus Coprenecus stercoravium]|uniref:tRNA(Ile)-lysidine synthase n=1 Tax=Candidatus Coprenecus stercoravium TaxID=2840735 RepID=A0A9D2K9M0_9BACT|nr:tRNA lysidine(34) synthetase TilS [Candidatus Coprenecus stercoravium]